MRPREGEERASHLPKDAHLARELPVAVVRVLWLVLGFPREQVRVVADLEQRGERGEGAPGRARGPRACPVRVGTVLYE